MLLVIVSNHGDGVDQDSVVFNVGYSRQVEERVDERVSKKESDPVVVVPSTEGHVDLRESVVLKTTDVLQLATFKTIVRPPIVLFRMVLVVFLTPVIVEFLCLVQVLVSLVEIRPLPQATLLSSTVFPVQVTL